MDEVFTIIAVVLCVVWPILVVAIHYTEDDDEPAGSWETPKAKSDKTYRG